MYFLRQGLNDLIFGWDEENVDLVSKKLNRTQLKELLLESGIARRAGKQLLVVLGLFQRQLLLQSAGNVLVLLCVGSPLNLLSFSTVRRLRELTQI